MLDPFSPRCACHRLLADCHRGELPENYCRRGLPDRYLPLVQMASLIAYGDLDYIAHLTEVVEREGRRIRVEKGSCPPIDEAIHRLYGLARTEQIQLIGCRSPTGRRDDIRPPFEPIPADLFANTDWGYEWLDPFSICRAGHGAGWFCPAAERTVIEKLRSNSASDHAPATAATTTTTQGGGQARPTPARKIIEDHRKARAREGRAPSQAVSVALVQAIHPKMSREIIRRLYGSVTGRGIRDRGRRMLPKPPRFTDK
jgi:hypothetical protein